MAATANGAALIEYTDESLREEIAAHQRSTGISTSLLAAEMGVHPNKLRGFLSGDYAMPILRGALKRYLAAVRPLNGTGPVPTLIPVTNEPEIANPEPTAPAIGGARASSRADDVRATIREHMRQTKLTPARVAEAIGCEEQRLWAFLGGERAYTNFWGKLDRYAEHIRNGHAIPIGAGLTSNEIEALAGGDDDQPGPGLEPESQPECPTADDDQRLSDLAEGFTLDLTGAIDLGVDEDPVRAALFNAFAIINDEYELVGDERDLADRKAAELATRHTRLAEQRVALEHAYRVICNYTSQRSVTAEMALRGKF